MTDDVKNNLPDAIKVISEWPIIGWTASNSYYILTHLIKYTLIELLEGKS